MLINYRLQLPYPPSVNHYWLRNRNGGMRISDAGVAYKQAVARCFRDQDGQFIHGRLAVEIAARPPDRRRRDLDNILKCLLDSLGGGLAYIDDQWIHDLRVYWNVSSDDRIVVVPGGQLEVELTGLQTHVLAGSRRKK